MGRRGILGAVAAIAASAAIAVATPASPVAAGDVTTPVDVDIEVYAPGASTVLAGLTVEVWDISGDPSELTDACDTPFETYDEPLLAAGYSGCDVPDGTFALGIDGVPAGATVNAECAEFEFEVPEERIPGSTVEFSVDIDTWYVDCTVIVIQPAVIVDKIVDGGEADTSDFTIEVFDDIGTKITEDSDPNDAFCVYGNVLEANCAVIPLPAGAYQLGEIASVGYAPTNVWCDPFQPEVEVIDAEVFPDDIGAFELGDAPQGALPFVWCIVTNDYYEGDLIVEKVVQNDDGGTATADQFTAEIYRESDGVMVADQQCAANGDCLSETLPIGEYRIGESGPAGYTPTVSCSVTGEPDGPPPIGTSPPLSEAIPGDDALATVEPFGEVTCVITNDDPTTTTSTTTTTTTTTTTVLATTTTDLGGQPAVPTTVAPILPATGPGDSNGTMAVIALVLLAVGGSLLALRRRPA